MRDKLDDLQEAYDLKLPPENDDEDEDEDSCICFRCEERDHYDNMERLGEELYCENCVGDLT